MIAGSVPEAGNANGAGWQSIHVPLQTGTYLVSFPVPFNGTPVVVVTLVNPQNDDNTICVKGVTANGFTVVSHDIDPASVDGSTPQDSAFNFIAVGSRG